MFRFNFLLRLIRWCYVPLYKMTQCFLFNIFAVKSESKEEVANEQNIYGMVI